MLITQPSELEQFSAQHRVWQGMPGIVKTKGGRIFVSFYSGNVTEDYGNYSVVIKSDDGKSYQKASQLNKEKIQKTHEENAR